MLTAASARSAASTGSRAVHAAELRAGGARNRIPPSIRKTRPAPDKARCNRLRLELFQTRWPSTRTGLGSDRVEPVASWQQRRFAGAIGTKVGRSRRAGMRSVSLFTPIGRCRNHSRPRGTQRSALTSGDSNDLICFFRIHAERRNKNRAKLQTNTRDIADRQQGPGTAGVRERAKFR